MSISWRTLYRQNLDSRSVARHLVTIRHFFRFALTEGYITDDPAANIESPKFRQSLPEFLSVEEVDRLLRQPDASDDGRVARQSDDRTDVFDGLARFRAVRSARCPICKWIPAACAASAKAIRSASCPSAAGA